MGEKDQMKELETLRQMEEIERMLEKAGRLRAAAANHRKGFEETEREEKKLWERVRELKRSRETGKETKKGGGWF